jgi:restriction system protein
MSLWLVRAGKYGEHEQRFFTTNRVYLTWGGLENTSLADARDVDAIKAIVNQSYPDVTTYWRGQGAGQIAAFILAMQPGD